LSEGETDVLRRFQCSIFLPPERSFSFSAVQ
jgi:hypothetical protein